jgi:hypothetical protein
MPAEFKAIIAERYKVINKRDKAYFCYKFNKVKEMSVIAYIFTILLFK